MGITQQIGASSLIKPGVIDNTAARPASPYEGQVIFQKDTDQLLVWNGTAWVIPNSPAQNPTGLELISTTTVGTAVSSVTVTGAFSTTYDNYRIVINAMAASVDAAQIRFTINGSTGSTYHLIGTNMDYGSATVYPVSGAAVAFFRIGETSQTSNNLSFDIYSPFLAATSFISSCFNGTSHVGWYNGKDTNAASSTAFTLTPSSGTVTGGTVTVYGYRK